MCLRLNLFIFATLNFIYKQEMLRMYYNAAFLDRFKTYAFSLFKSFPMLWGKNCFQNIVLNFQLMSSDWNSGKFYYDFLFILSTLVSVALYIIDSFPTSGPLCGSQYRPTLKTQKIKSTLIYQYFYERAFNKLFKDTQVDRLCTCASLVIDD